MVAVHLSRLRPSCSEEYLLIARRHQGVALPAFRTATHDINEKNCHALVAFSKGLLWAAFASLHEPDSDIPLDGDGSEDWLPQWFHLLRGSCLLVNGAHKWIKEGPYVCLVNYLGQSLDHTPCPCPDDEHIMPFISYLTTMLMNPLLDVERHELGVEVNVALHLRDSFTRTSIPNQNTPLRNTINAWMSSLPQDYIQFLRERKLRSLVILAYFCVLIHRSETVWFMQGNAERLLVSILRRLDNRHREWIAWPCSLILPTVASPNTYEVATATASPK
ncbi:hypothetical protein MMC14_010047 [Varicellaria rhodocarpa]|nr:hypothetical protein [Varicellaria rhodocarpa]